ncbi:MAG: methylated-DNA--[protein]-cysteine S-methyltransferase [Syntrophomonadaceae bacterium]
MKSIFFYQTDIGEVGIAADETGVTHVNLQRAKNLPDAVVRETRLISEAARQLQCYLEGGLKHFDLPLAPAGSEFMQRVWASLQTIPYGETWSYKKLAESIGNPQAARAVGQANHRNPIPIFIPCHRVVGADGKLTGYGSGLPLKAYLLDLERQYGSA